MPDTERPPIADINSASELKRWYWLKAELEAHARTLGLPSGGGKFEILDRIGHFLDTGEVQRRARRKASSGFDWHASELTDATILTDSYKNTQNVRRYFKSRLGERFKFNIEFMAWLRTNAGRTLGEACDEYRAMKAREAAPGYRSDIPGHNQFNQYTRDFLDDNPEMGMDDVRKYWELKIALPSEDGRHVYEKSDLKLG
ncbi:MAG: DUF6434 domain-containing protein [Pseudomonadota bacterium]